MTKPSGAGKPKLREPRRPKSPSMIDSGGLFAELKTPEKSLIRPEHIRQALAEARAISDDEFRRQQQGWLNENYVTLMSAIQSMYENTIKSNGIDTANGAHMGAYLGSEIIRRANKDATIERFDCLKNLGAWSIGFSGIRYEPITQDDLLVIYTPEASEAFMEIRTESARSMAATVVGFATRPYVRPVQE